MALIFSPPSFAIRWAKVIAKKAIVYAGPTLDSPIGHIKRGKKVKIGEVAKNRGQSIAAIISGKLVYIKLSDIKILGSSRQRINTDAKTHK